MKLWGGGVLLEPARGKVTGFFGLKPPCTYLGPVFYGQVRSDLDSIADSVFVKIG